MSGNHEHTHHHETCPNCARTLTPAEIYCYFCEMDISELKKKHKHDHDGNDSHGKSHH